MRFIKKTTEYQDIYREHYKVQSEYFTLLYKLKAESNEAAVGIVIRGKVGKAVIRNILKRRIRAYLKQKQNNINNNIAAVIIGRVNAAEAGWQDINNDLDRCFGEIKDLFPCGNP